MGKQQIVYDLVNQAHQLMQKGELDGAVLLLEQVIERSVAESMIGPEASARGLMAQVLSLGGQSDEALMHAHRGLQIAKDIKDEDGIAHFEQLIAMLSSQEQSVSMVDALRYAKSALEDRDDAGAIGILKPLIAATVEQGDQVMQGTSLGLLAKACYRLGDVVGAKEAIQSAILLAKEVGNEESLSYFKAFEKQIEVEPTPKNGYHRPYSERLSLARAQAEKGNFPLAIADTQAVVQDCQSDGAKGPEASALYVLAQLLQLIGQRDQAVEAIDAGLLIVKTLGDGEAEENFEQVRKDILAQ